MEKLAHFLASEVGKNGTSFGTGTHQVKILARLGTLACQVEKLTGLCHIGTFIGTLARGYVDHAGT